MTAASAQRGGRVPFALYPAAVLVLLAVHLWATSGVSPFAAVRGMVATAAIGIVVAGAGGLIVRDRHRGGVVGLLLALLVLAGSRPGIVPLLFAAIALMLFERYGPTRFNLNWARIGSILSRITIILALAVLLEAIQLGRLGDLIRTMQTEGPARAQASVLSPPDAPDIYVIMLDGYARADMLAERFEYDDSRFLDGLTQRGFTIAGGSHSNYLVTNLSLNSLLNHRQLADIPSIQPLLQDPVAPEGPPVYRSAATPAIVDDMRSLGYTTVAISSGFEQVAVRGADRFIDTGQINEFEIQLLRPSVLSTIATAVSADVFSAQQRERIESVFASLEGLAHEPSSRPRFIFGHVPSPHAPRASSPTSRTCTRTRRRRPGCPAKPSWRATRDRAPTPRPGR
jgi:hypothetical protein